MHFATLMPYIIPIAILHNQEMIYIMITTTSYFAYSPPRSTSNMKSSKCSNKQSKNAK